MVLGIVGLVFCWFFYFGIPCALIGLILSAVGIKKSNDAGMPAGMATAGLVCSIITMALSIMFIVVCGVVISSCNDMFDSFNNSYYDYW